MFIRGILILIGDKLDVSLFNFPLVRFQYCQSHCKGIQHKGKCGGEESGKSQVSYPLERPGQVRGLEAQARLCCGQCTTGLTPVRGVVSQQVEVGF